MTFFMLCGMWNQCRNWEGERRKCWKRKKVWNFDLFRFFFFLLWIWFVGISCILFSLGFILTDNKCQNWQLVYVYVCVSNTKIKWRRNNWIIVAFRIPIMLLHSNSFFWELHCNNYIITVYGYFNSLFKIMEIISKYLLLIRIILHYKINSNYYKNRVSYFILF